MISAEQCYRVWTATNLHCFTKNYDAIKYNFKVRKTIDLSTHKDRFVYLNMSKKMRSTENAISFSLSNACQNIRYIRDASFDFYYEFEKKREGIFYWVKEDINKIAEELTKWKENGKVPSKFFINSSKNNLSRILTWYRQGKISFHTVATIQKLYLFLDKLPYNGILYDDTILFLKKASRLLLLGDVKDNLREVIDERIVTPFNINF